jgi:hypothetical protein
VVELLDEIDRLEAKLDAIRGCPLIVGSHIITILDMEPR